jgi:hypothetical protein
MGALPTPPPRVSSRPTSSASLDVAAAPKPTPRDYDDDFEEPPPPPPPRSTLRKDSREQMPLPPQQQQQQQSQRPRHSYANLAIGQYAIPVEGFHSRDSEVTEDYSQAEEKGLIAGMDQRVAKPGVPAPPMKQARNGVAASSSSSSASTRSGGAAIRTATQRQPKAAGDTSTTLERLRRSFRARHDAAGKVRYETTFVESVTTDSSDDFEPPPPIPSRPSLAQMHASRSIDANDGATRYATLTKQAPGSLDYEMPEPSKPDYEDSSGDYQYAGRLEPAATVRGRSGALQQQQQQQPQQPQRSSHATLRDKPK